MNSYSYFESLRFDRERVMKKNKSRVNNLNNIKVVGTLKEKNKYNYISLNDKLVSDKDIVISDLCFIKFTKDFFSILGKRSNNN